LIDVSLTVSPIFDAQGRVIGASKIARDVTERKRLEDSLRDSERRLRTLTEAVPNLLWSDGPDGQCDWLSSQWTTYTGVPVEELLGLRWLDRVIHPDDRQRTLACWRTACADRGDYDLEYRIRRHDGEYHWFKTRGVPLRDKQGTIIQWFGTCTDIEESKRLEAELREADRRKDEFLATLAHELRNPLAPLRQGLELLRAKGGLGTDSEAIQRMMERQVDHMVRLVDDLMEVSRITRGKIELRTELLDLRAVIRGAIETSQPLIDAAGHVLSVHLPDRPLYVRGDALRLSQVLTNLLNNAAKYTPRGGRIWLSARSGGAEAVVSVRDNGLGIPPEMLPNVFQMFTQIDRNLQRAQGGLGIGLALVKSLAQMHGGGVQVASEGAGQGSQFTLHLPLAEPSQSARAGLSANGHRTAARPRRRVLVVDDNRDGADSLGMLLRVSGEEVRVAYDGPSALETAVTFRPEIALLDIGMPGMSGYELAGALRERDDSKRLVLIAMTGWGQEDDRRRTREAGFCAHLVKPVDFPKLQALLDELPAAV
jgi:two-component system CheB/CheR fusion protein